MNKGKITDFEWYNNIGATIRFNDVVGRHPVFHMAFIRDMDKDKLTIIGVRWKYDNRIIVINNISECGTIPTPDMNYVVVSYYNANMDYKYETFILNADGSVYKKIEIPNRTHHFNSRDPWDDPTFIQDIRWIDNTKNGFTMEAVLAGTIGGCWESRLFNPDIGEFGECTGYGYD